MKKILLSTSILCTLSFAAPVFSLDVGFLADSPVQYFNDADWDLFNAASDKALNKVADGERVSWYNPNTGSGGSFQPLKTTTKNNLTCRNLRISDYANRQKDSYVFTFCKYPTGWKVFQK